MNVQSICAYNLTLCQMHLHVSRSGCGTIFDANIKFKISTWRPFKNVHNSQDNVHYRGPSGDRQSTTHGCYRGLPPSGIRVGLSCCRPDGRCDHTAEGGGGGRPAPEPQGAPRGVRAVPKPFPDDFPEDSLRDGGLLQKDIGSPVDMLVDTVSQIQKDIAILREENRLLRTPAT